jgi:uncharacterized membrane protein YeaQ/YmgE (transglycosylase-associated protein family)
MHLSGESLLVILFVGLIAGFLAGKIVRGSGFGLIGDIAIGIVGAFIASWLSGSEPAWCARSSTPPSARWCCSSSSAW